MKRAGLSASVRMLLGMLAGVAIGLAGVYVTRFVLRDAIGAKDVAKNVSGAWAAASIIFGITLPLFLHEAGHITGGRLVGFRFALYAAGPFMITREGERLKFQLHRHWALYGGIAASTPVDDRDLLRRMSWMVAAGPITSLVVGAIAFAGALLIDPSQSGPRFFLFVMGVSAAGNFLAVTLPSKTGGFLTDRSRFLLLRRGGVEAERVAAGALISARNMAGERPRDWPPSAIETLEQATDASLDSLMGQLGHLVKYYEDTDREADALATIERGVAHLDALPPLLHPMIWLEQAYLIAVVNRDATRARETLTRVGPRAFVESWDRLRVEAAILLAEGNLVAAEDAVARALSQIATTTRYGTTLLAHHQLDQLAERTRRHGP